MPGGGSAVRTRARRSSWNRSALAKISSDQNDADYAEFTDAADEQRIEVERGV